jgi:predicted TIM-barrel fold metal-dependent hydrolase
MTRRTFLFASGVLPVVLGQERLPLADYQPRSMLHVRQHPVARARFPVIDVHTHLFGLNRAAGDLRQVAATMDQCNLQTLINLTGGTSASIPLLLKAMGKYGKKFLTAAEPTWSKANEPDYAKWQVDELEKCQKAGARGVKVLKTLGLYLRDRGKLVKVDDRRFDPLWDAAGALGLPVLIHTGDPAAFFLPIDRFNERYEELKNHPDWSFYDKDFPSKKELLEARNRVIARHPKTTFIGLHVANFPEDLAQVGSWLEKYRNLNVEIGARLGELGRQPRTSRRFFETYQDRILFGTDATPNGKEYPQQDLTPAMYRCYFRFLETEDEYFDYSPASTPPQGRWRIYGIALPDAILKKVYRENAIRVFNLV